MWLFYWINISTYVYCRLDKFCATKMLRNKIKIVFNCKELIQVFEHGNLSMIKM